MGSAVRRVLLRAVGCIHTATRRTGFDLPDAGRWSCRGSDRGRGHPFNERGEVGSVGSLLLIFNSDPASQWKAAWKSKTFFACSNGYLIERGYEVIADVEASRSNKSADVNFDNHLISCWTGCKRGRSRFTVRAGSDAVRFLPGFRDPQCKIRACFGFAGPMQVPDRRAVWLDRKASNAETIS